LITSIEVKNFKCFKALQMSLGRLTLLTGFNAAGKSTTLQSLLLLAQTLRTNERCSELRLNGPLVHLGSPGDVINQDQTSTELELGISTENTNLIWKLKSDDRDEKRVLRVSAITITGEERRIGTSGELRRLLPELADDSAAEAVETLRQIIYVSAVRQVGTDVFSVPEDPEPIHADVGAFGEYAPWWFHQLDDAVVETDRCVKGLESARTLRTQVNAWLGELFPGAEANAQPVAKTQMMRLELRTGRTGEWRRPSNTGYGLSYAFPILVAGLCAKPNQLLIIDSPEAHLHPRGQAGMGRFLAQVAASGLQVIVETHSDHVLNGIRISLKDQVVRPEHTSVYFFGHRQESEGSSAAVISLAIDQNGNLSHWPAGFFDQAEHDLANLAGWA
jgi:predicted ATPase